MASEGLCEKKFQSVEGTKFPLEQRVDDLTMNLKIEKEEEIGQDKVEWDKLPKGLETFRSAPSGKQDGRYKLKGA